MESKDLSTSPRLARSDPPRKNTNRYPSSALNADGLSVKQNVSGRIKLLQEIKIKNIAGQHGAAMLSSCRE
jgi:hypothetical protein